MVNDRIRINTEDLFNWSHIDDPIGSITQKVINDEMVRFKSKLFNTQIPQIKNVIFNDPATIVFWTDGTKTVVKAQDDDAFDPEKGLAMAISKKALGNKGNYCNELKKWLPKTYLCMYCGAETTNDSFDHACDECRNEPFDPIPESLKKDIYSKIKLPHVSDSMSKGIIDGMKDASKGLREAQEAVRNLAKALNEKKKRSKVQKAYDILVACRDKCEGFDFDELIGYLGEALED